jgi:hypothetical protein
MVATPVAVVDEYFARMQAGDVGVSELFHDDARLVGLGRIVEGRRAIDVFYTEAIHGARPAPRLVDDVLAAGSRVAVEIIIELDDAPPMHVMDLFVVEEGKIRSLTYFVADHP